MNNDLPYLIGVQLEEYWLPPFILFAFISSFFAPKKVITCQILLILWPLG